MKESMGFPKALQYYHWVLVIFIYLFVYLFIFSVNKFILTTVKISFYNLSLLKFFDMQKQVFSRRRLFCRCAASFQGRILLRSRFCIVVLLRICFMFREPFLENTSRKLLLNKDNFIYDFQFVLLNKTETKSFCVVFCLMFPQTFMI